MKSEALVSAATQAACAEYIIRYDYIYIYIYIIVVSYTESETLASAATRAAYPDVYDVNSKS